jgi:hypothetical protein
MRANRTALKEACDELGRPRAAVLFLYLMQISENDLRARRTITNFGGLFRSYTRKVLAGTRLQAAVQRIELTLLVSVDVAIRGRGWPKSGAPYLPVFS